MPKTFAIVGAGVGGLATALRLAHRGHRVIVLEKTDQVGGRNRMVEVGDCSFDGGPTLLMMLDPFRKVYSDVGERLEDHLDLRLCDPSYRTFFADASRIDGTPNAARMIDQIRSLSGERDALAYPKMLAEMAALYETAVPNFVRKNWKSPLGLAEPRQLARVARHRMLANLYHRVTKHVQDERLRMLFSFQTMYLGLSPFDAPYVYSVLTYMEYGEGIWYPMGGMTEIARSLAGLAEARGAEIRLNSPVASIEGKQVRLESGETIGADAIVCNADLPYADRELLGEAAKPRRSSCSALMVYIDYEGELDSLLHHNVFFGRDYRRNLDALFHGGAMPSDPAFYACLACRTDPSRAPGERLGLYLLIPCPNLDRPLGSDGERALLASVFKRLCRESGFDTGSIRAMRTFGPSDWASELNLDRGAAFGLAHTTFQSACFRPANRSKTNPSVYFVGASTVPGNGLPMVLISAELAEQRLIAEQGA